MLIFTFGNESPDLPFGEPYFEAGGFTFAISTALRIAFQVFLYTDVQQKAMLWIVQ
jgi:hypothetical protein